MSEYIDRDVLRKAITEYVATPLTPMTPQDIVKVVWNAPTADVVEVVRCKDCKFWGIPHANDIEKSHYCCRDNMWCMPSRFADDYCSYGERRANDET